MARSDIDKMSYAQLTAMEQRIVRESHRLRQEPRL